jgi:carbon-monoxide dehydrogenase medium subunit
MAIAIVNLCTRISLDATGVVKTARIVLGSVAATPIRSIEVESLLTGSALTDDLIDRAGAMAKREASPITDVRASEEYRRKMVQVFVSRTLRMNRDKLGVDCNV